MALARFSSAICYVLPVSRMTSCFHTVRLGSAHGRRWVADKWYLIEMTLEDPQPETALLVEAHVGYNGLLIEQLKATTSNLLNGHHGLRHYLF